MIKVATSRASSKAAQIAKEDLAQRLAARTILNPDEVAGDYDASRLLMTTIGGKARMITLNDIKAFAANARRVGRKYKGGISPQGVIDHSLQADRKRANEQIKQAVPHKFKGNELNLVTNAGPDSDKTRHFVQIHLLNFPPALASPKTPVQLAKYISHGPVKFECDCGRHQFWYRYIATIGKYNAGRPETGYPKIRNPNLTGVACKHVLRVMTNLLGGSYNALIAKQLQSARKSVNDKFNQTLTAKQSSEFIAKRVKPVKATSKVKAAILSVKASHAKRIIAKAEKVLRSLPLAKAGLKALLDTKAVTRSQYNAMLKALTES
jgi:hypothetical protein